MAEISLNVNNKNYGIACDDGQEERVRELGRYVDERLKAIAGSGAGSSENQNLVLTAIVLADEIADLREYAEKMQQSGTTQAEPQVEIKEVVKEVEVPVGLSEEDEAEFAGQVNKLAERIDQLAGRMAKAA